MNKKEILILMSTDFDENTNAASYIVKDPSSSKCAIIDSVLDFDVSAGAIKTEFADKLVQKINDLELDVEWVIETTYMQSFISSAVSVKEIFCKYWYRVKHRCSSKSLWKNI